MLNAEASLASICQTIARQRVGGMLSRVTAAKEALKTADDTSDGTAWNDAYLELCDANEELRATVLTKLGLTNGELAMLCEVLA